MYCNFVNTLFISKIRKYTMTGLAIGLIKARDEISEVVVVVVVVVCVFFFFLSFFGMTVMLTLRFLVRL